ncbi:MAG: hypothetical protein GXP45_05100 [bacterium]|nr:hypothetical protein [bacterium]
MDDDGKQKKFIHSQTMNYYQIMLFLADNVLMPITAEQLAMRELAEKQEKAK